MKAISRFYKGIEYVVVNDLPVEQQSVLNQNSIDRIKILMEGKVVSNCMSYQEYSDWYHSVYRPSTPMSKSVQEGSSTIKIKVSKA